MTPVETIRASGVSPSSFAFVSDMTRARETLKTALAALGQDLPHTISTALRERDYGDLAGLNKDEARAKWGEEQVRIWRRSYETAPPGGESLRDTVARVLPYYCQVILPCVLRGEAVLVVAHGNSLRALVKHLDGISDEDIAALNIPTGIPLYYELDENLRPLVAGGEYLDPEAAASSIQAVANQGKK